MNFEMAHDKINRKTPREVLTLGCARKTSGNVNSFYNVCSVYMKENSAMSEGFKLNV